MATSRRSLLKNSAATAATLSLGGRLARAEAEEVRIGVIYDLSGPFAAGGSVACSIGCQIAIDLVNERGGIAGKYKVVPINADSQSKADVAINEVERLLGQEKVEIVNGVYSSAHAVPLAAKVEAQKKILWITTAVATAVFKDKNLHYVFRAQIHSDQYGEAFAKFLAENAKAKLGKEPKRRQGRDHSRGRSLWRRRRRGQRTICQGARAAGRDARRLLGGGARSVVAGHQAQARRRRCHIPRRL